MKTGTFDYFVTLAEPEWRQKYLILRSTLLQFGLYLVCSNINYITANHKRPHHFFFFLKKYYSFSY